MVFLFTKKNVKIWANLWWGNRQNKGTTTGPEVLFFKDLTTLRKEIKDLELWKHVSVERTQLVDFVFYRVSVRCQKQYCVGLYASMQRGLIKIIPTKLKWITKRGKVWKISRWYLAIYWQRGGGSKKASFQFYQWFSTLVIQKNLG